MNRRTAARLGVALFLGLAVPASAHHSAAAFDTEKDLTLKGTVREWVWANPHCFLIFDVKDERGTVTSWTVETQHPQDIMPRGFRRTSFKPGDAVAVTMSPAKDRSPTGRIRSILLADGSRLPTELTP
jgi:hypothetical protein